MTFNSKFKLKVYDYNNDGVYELLIGQYGVSNYNLYNLYYIDEKLGIGKYDDFKEIPISSDDMSPILDNGYYKYYDNANQEWVEHQIEVPSMR